MEKHVFAFVNSAVIKHERFHNEKYFVERVHNLMSEFIYRMPEKIKDLKLRNEEYFSRGEEISVAFHGDYKNNLLHMNAYSAYHNINTYSAQNPMAKLESYHDFEDFLNLLGDLYNKDPLKLELSLNYWIADTQANSASDMNYHNLTQKQVKLPY